MVDGNLGQIGLSHAERVRLETRVAALAEIAGHQGRLATVRLSDEARGALLELYARALVGRGRPLGADEHAEIEAPAMARG